MSRRDGGRAGLGAIAGLLAAGTALGVGQFVAGLTGASGSPVVAVGELQIDFTPPWLKNFAITEFGPDDKLVLVSGILVVLAIFAAVIGAAATRRMAYGMAGLGVFAVVGLTAAATRPTATFASLLPTLAAVLAAVAVLRLLIPLIPPVSPAVRGGRPRVMFDPVLAADPVWLTRCWRLIRPRNRRSRGNSSPAAATHRRAAASSRPARRPRASPPGPDWRAVCWPSGAAWPMRSGPCASRSPRSPRRR